MTDRRHTTLAVRPSTLPALHLSYQSGEEITHLSIEELIYLGNQSMMTYSSFKLKYSMCTNVHISLRLQHFMRQFFERKNVTYNNFASKNRKKNGEGNRENRKKITAK